MTLPKSNTAVDPFRIPTEADIEAAEKLLSFVFPASYRSFLLSGSSLENAVFDAAVIFPGSGWLDIFEMADHAWNNDGISKKWLPFIYDNGNYFLISELGEVKFWDHNGATNEKWSTFQAWFQQVCIDEK